MWSDSCCPDNVSFSVLTPDTPIGRRFVVVLSQTVSFMDDFGKRQRRSGNGNNNKRRALWIVSRSLVNTGYYKRSPSHIHVVII